MSTSKVTNSDQLIAFNPFEVSDEALPEEIWQQIHFLTGPKQLLTSALVSRRFYHICRDQWIWKALCERAPFFRAKKDQNYRIDYFTACATKRNFVENDFKQHSGPFPKDAEFLRLNAGAGSICFSKNDGVIKLYNAENESFEIELNGNLPPLFTQAYECMVHLLNLAKDLETGNELTEEHSKLSVLSHLKKLEQFAANPNLKCFFELFNPIVQLIKDMEGVEEDDLSPFITYFPMSVDYATALYMHHLRLQGGSETILFPVNIQVGALSDKYAIIAYTSNIIDVFNRETGERLQTFMHASDVQELFIQDENLFIFSSDSNLTELNLENPTKTLSNIGNVKICKQIDGPILLMECDSEDVKLLNMSTGQLHTIFKNHHPSLNCCFDGLSKTRLAMVYQTHNDGHLDLVVFNYKSPISFGEVFMPDSFKVIPIPFHQSLSWDNGYIWLLDQEGKIQKVDPETGTISEIYSPGDNAEALSFHWNREKLFIHTDRGGVQILSFSPLAKELSDLPPEEVILGDDLNRPTGQPLHKRRKRN